MRSGALFRVHWIPDRSVIWMRPGALFRAHWIPDRPTNCQWSGALFRARWTPDRWANCMRSGALLRALWNPDPSDVTKHGAAIRWCCYSNVRFTNKWRRYLEMEGSIWKAQDTVWTITNKCITTWIPTRGIWLWTCGASTCAKRREISAQAPIHLKRQKEKTAERGDVD